MDSTASNFYDSMMAKLMKTAQHETESGNKLRNHPEEHCGSLYGLCNNFLGNSSFDDFKALRNDFRKFAKT